MTQEGNLVPTTSSWTLQILDMYKANLVIFNDVCAKVATLLAASLYLILFHSADCSSHNCTLQMQPSNNNKSKKYPPWN